MLCEPTHSPYTPRRANICANMRWPLAYLGPILAASRAVMVEMQPPIIHARSQTTKVHLFPVHRRFVRVGNRAVLVREADGLIEARSVMVLEDASRRGGSEEVGDIGGAIDEFLFDRLCSLAECRVAQSRRAEETLDLGVA
jgi:hypothetical protein